MAFCNSCGAVLTPGTKFCNKCGAAAAAGPAASVAVPAAPVAAAPIQATTGGSSSALKIILIVIAVIVGLGILSVGAFSFFVYRVAKSAHVTQQGDRVKVDTPFGSVSANDPAQSAKDLGIDIYPGAESQKNGATSMTFGSIHTVTATFESRDSMDKICTFYKAKFPNAMTTSSDQSRCTIVSNDQKNMVTINIETNGDGAKFQITNVSKKGASDSSN